MNLRNVVAAALFGSSSVLAAPGDLDPTFNGTGIVITPVGGGWDQVHAMGLQPDGKLIAAGVTMNATDMDIALVRYHPDGHPDSEFGSSGKVITPISMWDIASSVLVQPDGKIVVAGYTIAGINHDVALVRYNPDGSLDTAFGTGGVATAVTAGIAETIHAAALQPDGKIVVAGRTDNGSNESVFLARYLPTGLLDNSFGSDGTIATNVPGRGDASARSLAIQPDGGIVVAGESDDGWINDVTVIRYTADGVPDGSFGTGGFVSLPMVEATSVAVQPDGRILVFGSATRISRDFVLVRLDPDGSIDPAFDGDGVAITDIGTGSDDEPGIAGLALQPDGKIIVAGSSHNGSNYDFAVVRYNADGSLDATFGDGGKRITPVGSLGAFGYSLALQPDGKVVLAGRGVGAANEDFALVRYIASDAPWELTPAPFSFTDESGVPLNSLQTSNLITVAGLGDGIAVPVSVSGGEYALNGSTVYTTARGWVSNGDQIGVRHTAAATGGTATDTVVTIGGLQTPNNIAMVVGTTRSDTYSSTTEGSRSDSGTGGGGGGGGAFGPWLLLALLPLVGRRGRNKHLEQGQC